MIFLICISCDACNLAFCLPPLQPERFVNLGIEPPKGVLLFGPPGTGKTLCARAVANRTDACFIRVIGSELVQKYVGEVRANYQMECGEICSFPVTGTRCPSGYDGWLYLHAGDTGSGEERSNKSLPIRQSIVRAEVRCHRWKGLCSAV